MQTDGHTHYLSLLVAALLQILQMVYHLDFAITFNPICSGVRKARGLLIEGRTERGRGDLFVIYVLCILCIMTIWLWYTYLSNWFAMVIAQYNKKGL